MDNRELLLKTGLELFSQSPYEAVGVQDIVNQVHVTKPTLYHYFGSKLGLYEAVFEQSAAPFFVQIAEKARYERDLVNNLNEIARVSLEFFRQTPEAYWLLEHAVNVSESSEHHDFVQKYWDAMNRSIEDLFEQAVVQHGNLKGKTALTSWLFIHAVRAEVYVVLTKREPYTPDLPYRLVHQFMYGIFA